MKTHIRTLGLAALAALLVGVIPAADAQTVPVCTDTSPGQIALKTTSLTPNDPRVKPITGVLQVKFTFTYTAPQQARSLNAVPVELTHSATESWLTTSLGSATRYIPMDPADQNSVSRDFDVVLDVTVADTAPANAKGNVEVTATAGEGVCVAPSNTERASQQVIAGFYENYQASFQTSIWKTGQNERIQIPLVVNNFGNGHIKVQLDAVEGTSGSLNFALPGVQTVESTIAGGESNERTIPVDIQTPFKNGYENRRDQLNLQVSGYYFADTEQKITPVSLQAVIQTQGVYVPGFDAIAMIGAAIGAALIVRRRL